MKGISNYLILKIKVGTNNLQGTKKCPNCDYEGLMECLTVTETTGTYCKCPNCKFTFGNNKNKNKD
jgi:hypothetical protein